MIFELLTTISFLAGLQIILTVILPIGVALYGTLLLIDRARLIVYRAGIDYLEFLARLESLRNDHARQELMLAEAGLNLRIKRLELRAKSDEN